MGAGASEHEYDVFLSYNSKSVEEVAALALRLRSEHGLRVFFDRWELVPGDPVIPALERAIDRSETVAVLVGRDGIGPWQELERQAALDHAVHTGRRVIPALLRGASPDGVPGFLRTRGWVELESAEGFARLVAGIVGKTPGEVLGHGSATAGGRAVAAAAAPPPEQIEPARPPSAATGSGTMPAEHPSIQTTDNRGATFGQQIIVHGNAVFGPMTVGSPTPSAPADHAPDDHGAKPPAPPRDFVEYRHDAVQRHRTLPLVGFNERVRVRIDLDGLYVALDVVLDHGRADRVVFNDAEHARRELEAGGRSQRIPLSQGFELARACGKRGLAMLGDPGSGKTTELRRALLSVLSEEPGRGPEAMALPAGALPVFLPLRNLHAGESLESFMQRELGERQRDVAARLVRRGNLLLLLDGLDEVADQAQRRRVARWIEGLYHEHTDSHFLVSSRFAGYVPEVRLDTCFLELHLRAMNATQVRRFVHNWYQTVEAAEAELERKLAGRGEPGSDASTAADVDARQVELLDDFRVPDHDHAEATHLLARFDAPEFRDAQVYSLTTNPLLLTAVCLVHRRHGGKLPHSRKALLEECTAVLLERWKQHEGLEPPLGTEDARRVLQPTALWMHGEHGRTQASGEELAPLVTRGFEGIGRPEVDAMRFLRSIRDESGLLTGWGMDRYGFMHLGFQEYFAALELCGRAPRWWQRDPLRGLAERLEQTWWQEVILLVLAQASPDRLERFMRYVVERPELVQWTGSAMMARVLASPSPALAGPLVELVEAGTRGEPSWQRLAAWARRRLGPGLEARQLAALDVLGRRMPEVVDGLGETLAGHPSAAVRRWWERRARETGRLVTKVVHGVELVLVPGGRFMMGSPKGDPMAYDDEKPQHEVELGSFWLARTPVTNAQYREYMTANPRVKEPEYWGNRQFNQDEQPVVGVSWDEAKAYCAWAGLQLPTEAQWEYACRAGTTTRYYSGDSEEDLKKVGWYSGNSGGRLHAVGELEPNGWGLYDMHGNVWEWCEDRWVNSYEGAKHQPGDGLRVKPVGDADRVLRGGYFGYEARNARSAYRRRIEPGGRYFFVGFRPAQGHP